MRALAIARASAVQKEERKSQAKSKERHTG
jgi:hypothetical protein